MTEIKIKNIDNSFNINKPIPNIISYPVFEDKEGNKMIFGHIHWPSGEMDIVALVTAGMLAGDLVEKVGRGFLIPTPEIKEVINDKLTFADGYMARADDPDLKDVGYNLAFIAGPIFDKAQVDGELMYKIPREGDTEADAKEPEHISTIH